MKKSELKITFSESERDIESIKVIATASIPDELIDNFCKENSYELNKCKTDIMNFGCCFYSFDKKGIKSLPISDVYKDKELKDKIMNYTMSDMREEINKKEDK